MTMAPLLDFVVGPPLAAVPVLVAVLPADPILDAPEALRFDSPAVIVTF